MNQHVDEWCKQHHITNYRVNGNVLEIEGNVVFFQTEYETCPLQMKVRGYVSIHIGSTDNNDLSKFFTYINGTLSLTSNETRVWSKDSINEYIIPAGCKRVICGPSKYGNMHISLQKSDTQLIQGSANIDMLNTSLVDAPQCDIRLSQYEKNISVRSVNGITAVLRKIPQDAGFMNLVLRLPQIRYKKCVVVSGLRKFNLEDHDVLRQISSMLQPENKNSLDPFELQELLINTGFTDAAKLL